MTECACRMSGSRRRCLTLLAILVLSGPVWVWAASPLETAMQVLRNIPTRLESAITAVEAFFEVPKAQLPSSAGLEPASPGNDPLPQPATVTSTRPIPPEATDAVFDLKQSLRREFVKITGSPEKALTGAQFQTMVSMGKFPYAVEADSYFQSHDVNKDGALSIGEFSPSFEELAKSADLEAITSAYLSGSGYSPSLVPQDSQGNRRRRRQGQGGP